MSKQPHARTIERRRYMRRRATSRRDTHAERQSTRAMLRALTREPLALPTDALDALRCDSDDSQSF